MASYTWLLLFLGGAAVGIGEWASWYLAADLLGRKLPMWDWRGMATLILGCALAGVIFGIFGGQLGKWLASRDPSITSHQRVQLINFAQFLGMFAGDSFILGILSAWHGKS